MARDYYVCTVGNIIEEAIKKYTQKQGCQIRRKQKKIGFSEKQFVIMLKISAVEV